MNSLETIVVTGANGILAKEIKLTFSKKIKVIFLSKKKLNISKYYNTYSTLKMIKPTLIINTAAYTNTENAQFDKYNVNKTNIVGIKNLVKISKLLNIKLIHFSSDYIFSGSKKKPYTESDKPNPINYYGKSKLLGEEIIKSTHYKKSMIIRTSLLYSKFNKNILKSIIKNLKKNNDLNFINDVICSPTSAHSLAKFLNYIIINNLFKYGVYNYCDTGFCSNYEFALYSYNKLTKLKLIQSKSKIYAIDQKNYSSKIIRPKFSSLNNEKVKKTFNYKINNWKENLFLVLKNLDKI